MLIYKITNLTNGKCYVGQTINSLVYRKNIHKQDWKLGRKSKYRLYQAFDKYDFSNFSWEVLEEVKSKEALNEKEKFWIRELNTFNRGYNMTDGGDYNPNIGKFGSKHHNSKSYVITHPDGLVETVHGLREWCRGHGLHHQGIIQVCSGKTPAYKGYTAIYLL